MSMLRWVFAAGRAVRRWYWRRVKWPLVGARRPVMDGMADDTEALQYILDSRRASDGRVRTGLESVLWNLQDHPVGPTAEAT